MLCGIQEHNLPPLDAVGLGGENWADNQHKIQGAVTVTIGSRVRDSANPDSDELLETAGVPGVYLYACATRRAASNGSARHFSSHVGKPPARCRQ